MKCQAVISEAKYCRFYAVFDQKGNLKARLTEKTGRQKAGVWSEVKRVEAAGYMDGQLLIQGGAYGRDQV